MSWSFRPSIVDWDAWADTEHIPVVNDLTYPGLHTDRQAPDVSCMTVAFESVVAHVTTQLLL
jgi:hypothetical protein